MWFTITAVNNFYGRFLLNTPSFVINNPLAWFSGVKTCTKPEPNLYETRPYQLLDKGRFHTSVVQV